jgi:hypothetical protein
MHRVRPDIGVCLPSASCGSWFAIEDLANAYRFGAPEAMCAAVFHDLPAIWFNPNASLYPLPFE